MEGQIGAVMFRELSGVGEALQALMEHCSNWPSDRKLPLEEAVGSILARDVLAPEDLPSFNRAAMDGYAVFSSSTRGASPSQPLLLKDALPVRTGSAVPDGYDAVAMLEDTVPAEGGIEIICTLPPFRNLSRIGEDVGKGDVVLPAGRRLRPPDLALLAALGLEEVLVRGTPRVAIIPTGSELVDRRARPKAGQAREINSLMASQYVEMWGGAACTTRIVPDSPEQISEALRGSVGSSLILTIGGTSVGEKDFVPPLLARRGELLFHGLRLTPGKPTAIGVLDKVPVVCLPGYPVAALAALYLLVRPAVQRLAQRDDPLRHKEAVLSGKVPSRPGYLTWARVSCKGGRAQPIMTSGSGILSSVARADGFVIVPEDREGLNQGETVRIWMLE